MAAKKYSAGAIFLQVVPVFANVQNAIESEAKNIDRALGDTMEKSGDKAGRRAGKAASDSMRDEISKGSSKISADMERDFRGAIDGMNKSLGDIDTSKMGDRVKREVKAMRQELETLSNVDIKVGDNFTSVDARLTALRGHLKEMEKGTKLRVDMDGLTQVYREVARLDTALAAVRDVHIDVDIDTKGAERKIGSFERSIKNSMAKAARSIDGSVNKELQRLKDELEYLGKLRVGVDIGSSQLRREVAEITAELEKLSHEDPEIDVKFDAGRAYAQLAPFLATMDRIDGRTLNVDVDVDTDSASRGLLRVTRDGESAANSFRSFNAVLFAAAGAGPALVPILAAIAGGLLAIGPAAAVGAAGLGSVLVGFSGIGDVLTALGQQEDSAAKDSTQAAKSMTSAANAVADAQRNLAQAREDSAKRIADAERSLARAKRDSAREEQNALRTLTRARQDAARAEADAERALQDARRNGARSIENAQERLRNSEETLAGSQRNVKKAQDALNEARKEAKRDIEDLGRSIRETQLSEDQAVIDLFEATQNYNTVLGDGASTTTEKEQARIDLEEAKLRLEEIRSKQEELAEEKAETADGGVEGTERVKDAQEDLNDALEAQREAQEDVADAAKDLAQTRGDVARDIADAERDLAETRRSNAEQIADAERALAETRRSNAEQIADAERGLAEARADGARAVADAARGLTRAQEGYKDALQSTGEIGSAAMQNVKNAMDKLGPAGKEFALFLFGLRGEFYAFRNDVQQVLLPAVQEAMQSFMGSESASIMRDTLIDLAGGFGEFAKALSTSFQGDAWTGFFQMLHDLGPDIQAAYGSAFISFLEAMASIMTTLAPYALDFAEALAAGADAFADWAESEEGQDAIRGFMDYVKSIAPLVLDFLGALWGAVVNLAKGMAEWGEVTLSNITDFLGFLADMDPKLLSAIVTSILVLITSSQTAYAVITTLLSIGTLLASTVGVVVFAIAGIALGLAYLYKTNESFRDFVQDAWVKIRAAFSEAWEIIKPSLMNLRDALVQLWYEVLQPLFAWLGPIIVWLATEIIPLLGHWFGLQINFISWLITEVWIPIITKMVTFFQWAWENILKPVWDAVSAAATFLWKWVLQPAFAGIQAEWSAMAIAFRWAWNNIIDPIWDAVKKGAKLLWNAGDGGVLGAAFDGIGSAWDTMGDVFGTVWDFISGIWNDITKKDGALDKLEGAFKATIGAIGTLWEGLKMIVGAPIKFVLDKVINEGLIDGFNKVAGWVGQDGFDHIPIPKALQSYATGGVMPGYTPGRDVHKFVSPTAGRLELSGGEAIMRPEFTAAVGPDWVNQMNGIARSGGVNALRQTLMGGSAYAKGGIFFPLPGGHMDTIGYSGHDGVDINVGSGSDDLGMPYYSATSGRVSSVGYGRGYGNAVYIQSPFGELVYGHSLDGSIRVGVGQPVEPGTWLARVGNTGNSSAPHLHFGFPGGTMAAAIDLLSGAPVGKPGKPGEGGGRSVPGFIKGLLKNPIDTIKGWASSKWGDASEAITDSPVWGYVKHVPEKLASGIKDKVMDIVPGWAKAAAGVVGKIGDKVGDIGSGIGDAVGSVGNHLGLKTGGILPYNGTMMYDNGGYLPPGLTSVVNLTGKPEPVFTADQFDGMEPGEGGGDHWENHFHEVMAEPEDIADTLMFRVRVKERRGTRYGGEQ